MVLLQQQPVIQQHPAQRRPQRKHPGPGGTGHDPHGGSHPRSETQREQDPNRRGFCRHSQKVYLAQLHLTSYTTHRSLPPLEFELLPASTSPSGLPRLRLKPTKLQYQPYDAIAECPNSHTHSRLQEIIARLGEICLTPELVHIVLFPDEAHAGSNVNSLACNGPAIAIGFMDELPLSSSTLALPAREKRLLSAGRFLTTFQARCLPPPTLTTLRNPLHLCAWRLETPPRVCLYTGEHPPDPTTLDLSTHLPHTLSKILLEDRTKRPTPSRIHLLNTDHDDKDKDGLTPNAVRTSLLHYAQTSLTSYRERLPLAKATAQDHTLEEAFASLIHPPARNHTTISLNQSPPWDKDHVDSRARTRKL